MERNRYLDKILRKTRKWLFPPSCPLCGAVLEDEEKDVCAECRPAISYLNAPTCMKCGAEISELEQELCEDCNRFQRSYIKGFPAMKYEYPIDESIAAFKYHNKRVYGDFFAKEIIKVHGEQLRGLQLDALVPIPVHKKKYMKRGYNQAQVLAEKIGEYLQVPVESDLLERCIHTPPQKQLDQHERELNMKKAFQSTNKIVNYKKVMLVDDIYTTGATVEACTRLLHNKGIRDVYYTSVSIGTGMK